jgi:hypothetical protein
MKTNEIIIGLLGTYRPDRRESMIKYTNLLMNDLETSGFTVIDLSPQPIFPTILGRFSRILDKFYFMVIELRFKAKKCHIVQIIGSV